MSSHCSKLLIDGKSTFYLRLNLCLKLINACLIANEYSVVLVFRMTLLSLGRVRSLKNDHTEAPLHILGQLVQLLVLLHGLASCLELHELLTHCCEVKLLESLFNICSGCVVLLLCCCNSFSSQLLVGKEIIEVLLEVLSCSWVALEHDLTLLIDKHNVRNTLDSVHI